MQYGISINTIDRQGGIGDGDIFESDRLTLDEAVSAFKDALCNMGDNDALDLTVLADAQLYERKELAEELAETPIPLGSEEEGSED